MGNTLYAVKQIHPKTKAENRRYAADRELTEQHLSRLSRGEKGPYRGRVLYDATFDNPGYWYRISLFRRALGLSHAEEVGVLGKYNAPKAQKTLSTLGIDSTVDFPKQCPRTASMRAEAKRLIAGTKTSADIFSWKLPFDFPGRVAYDSIQYKQRLPEVNVKDPLLEMYVIDILHCLQAASEIVTEETELLVLSHAFNETYGALAWVAMKRNVKIVVASGIFGMPRFWKFSRPGDIFKITAQLPSENFECLSNAQQENLAELFRGYVQERMGGTAQDIGTEYAYTNKAVRLARSELQKHFGWDDDKPIIGVYAPHWFDTPHFHGMENFRDYLDWMCSIIDVARKTPHFNWLLKNHPCEEWYGGITLHEVIATEEHAHVRLVDRTWNNAAIIEAVDAFVSCHGTIGLEATAIGKPVLVSESGWYGGYNFVKSSSSREDFLTQLSEQWWQDMDMEQAAFNAQVFGGFYFGIPKDMEPFVIPDDLKQRDIYPFLKTYLEDHETIFAEEARRVQTWWTEEEMYYHTYRVLGADDYVPITSASK